MTEHVLWLTVLIVGGGAVYVGAGALLGAFSVRELKAQFLRRG